MTDMIARNNAALSVLDTENISNDYYIEHYMDFVRRFISSGRPSDDTIYTYASAIDQFLSWCKKHSRHPLTFHEYQMVMYRDYLYNREYKADSIANKLVAIRAFYHGAIKIGLIKDNPVENVSVKRDDVGLDITYAFTQEQMNAIFEFCNRIENPLKRYRNIVIFALMGIEGLRRIEISRANIEDINWNVNVMLIRGKGHQGLIYPSNFTINMLKKYCSILSENNPAGASYESGPLIVSISHNSLYKRLTRDGVAHIAKTTLGALGLHQKGTRCHIFRHTCGTNLYAQTKDLRLVQETLRHRNPSTTARYTHVLDRLGRRYTEVISPKLKTDS